MINLILFFTFIALVCLQVANLASFSPEQTNVAQNNGLVVDDHHRLAANHNSLPTALTVAPSPVPNEFTIRTTSAAQQNTTNGFTNGQDQTSTPKLTTSLDPNADLDDQSATTTAKPDSATIRAPGWQPNKDLPDKIANNKSKPIIIDQVSSVSASGGSLDLNVLFYSIFIVYVSFIKLIYHNVTFIKRNMTEPGILMIFGIIWELVLRKIASINSQQSFPRFNSRIFFYLFLPSTVLESAALLSNKWLYLNLLPIIIHSIFGTLLNAASLGFTIYSLSRQNIFNLDLRQTTTTTAATIAGTLYNKEAHIYNLTYSSIISNGTGDGMTLSRESVEWPIVELTPPLGYDKSYITVGSSVELNNLTLADCLVFGTILSSVDSTTMLGVFRLFQVNDKLYYLTLGESLMNNAVVLVIFNLLLDFFNETRLTVVKIYIAIIQFFITLIGSVFVGLLIAGVALIAVRLTKRFQVPCSLTSYQNQCQAMVETLLILKLAYLTYTLAGLAGTSSIVSLATFGILQDQYIKHNLNLRSQLTFRQVVLATKTMGFSLVYPLLGMLLVEVADTGQFFQAWRSHEISLPTSPISNPSNESLALINTQANLLAASSGMLTSAAKVLNNNNNNNNNISNQSDQTNLYWNFKFLSLVTLVTITYRFIWIVLLSVFCNLFSSNQLKIKFKEQILVAYGGLKGPLAFALVNRLIEHEEYRDRTMRNKHLFIYTILFITFMSTILKGSFIRPLVAKMQNSLCHSQQQHVSSLDASQVPLASSNSLHARNGANVNHHGCVVFNEINCKVTEYMAHGLNNILGYRKSPYDRFVELNESFIKPWLTRDGSNTNWLSVFYDSLILDETLNDTCFYRSSAAVLQSYLHLSTRHRRPSNQQQQQQRRQRANLDTIDEHNDHQAGQRRITGEANLTQTKLLDMTNAHSSSLQRRKVTRNPQLVDERGSQAGKRNGAEESTGFEKNSVLKEYVMFDLKLEDARRRKQTAVSSLMRKQWSGKVEPSTSRQGSVISDWFERQQPNQLGQSKAPATNRMLSTTSSDDREGDLSATIKMDRRHKRHHLLEIERQLLAVDSAKLAGSDRPIDGMSPQVGRNQATGQLHLARQQPKLAKVRRGKTRAREQYEQRHGQLLLVSEQQRIGRTSQVGPIL